MNYFLNDLINIKPDTTMTPPPLRTVVVTVVYKEKVIVGEILYKYTPYLPADSKDQVPCRQSLGLHEKFNAEKQDVPRVLPGTAF